MRNDLSRLQIRCVNSGQGCDAVCCLETLHTHEDECPFTFISCSYTGCPVQVERRGLESHLLECEFRSRACPSGCGHTLLSVDQTQHNCVAELRIELELLRAEMLGKVEEVRREMESRLDSQRRHMVQKESLLKSEVEDLKGQVSRVVCDVRLGGRAPAETGAGRSGAREEGATGDAPEPAAIKEPAEQRQANQRTAS
ncbi:RING finger protein 151-like [Salmo trutta]|uniref:RING finger protein 151-like n=1 Tax=Salmo trutta TaxID=8032 RepID=UPI001132141A|nr:RING finger protein 151-like [Salmo trutta]XP_029602509.1 RING finger protein 151-like [Salmo trutta]XP_029602517.1 RING finger protein 151-like [Salmo trutta]